MKAAVGIAEPIGLVLSRLAKVRTRGKHQWSARCPAHNDKGPSLSVKQRPDGAVLLHCFAGCDVSEVLAAVGLDASDLFTHEPSTADAGACEGRRPSRRGLLPASQALEIVDFEASLAAVAAANLAHGIALTDADRARLMQAAGRIGVIAQEVRA